MLGKKILGIMLLLTILTLTISCVSAEELNFTDNATLANGQQEITETLDEGLSDSQIGDKSDDLLQTSQNQTFLEAGSKVSTEIRVEKNILNDYDVTVWDSNGNQLLNSLDIYVDGVCEHTAFGVAVTIDNPFNEYSYGYKTYDIQFKGYSNYLSSSKSFKIFSLTFKDGSHKVTISDSQYKTLKNGGWFYIWLDTYKTHKVVKSYKKKTTKVKQYSKYYYLGTFTVPVKDLYKSSAKAKARSYGKSLANKAKKMAKSRNMKVDADTFKYSYKIKNGKAHYNCYVKFYKYVKKTTKVPVYTSKKYRQYALFEYDEDYGECCWGITDDYSDTYDATYFTLY